MTTRKPWTDSENRAIVALYFAMLDKATAGETYNKAAMLRVARSDTAIAIEQFTQPYAGALADRSKGSIEAKLMNCTAAHRDLTPQAETMDGHGYRALPNYQRTTKDAMADALAIRGHRSQELTAHYEAAS